MLVRKFRLLIIKGQDEGLATELDLRPVLVGRLRSCDLALNDPTAAPVEVEFEIEADGVRMRTLTAHDGTHEMLAKVGMPIVVGRTVLRLDPTESTLKATQTLAGRASDHVGRSAPMQLLLARLAACAQSDAPTLLEGEPGTGKKLAARAIHDHSARAQGPYEVLDCARLSGHGPEQELFGAVGDRAAANARPILLERLKGGTLVLNEIAALSPSLQLKLLSWLQGSHSPVRILATTSLVLAREVGCGRFNEDLYARLRTLHVKLPPLRRRAGDIPRLVEHFLGEDHNFPAAWLRVLQEYDWPGNVRELRDVLARAQASLKREGIRVPIQVLLSDQPLVDVLSVARGRFEREYLRMLLDRTRHNITHAARMAGLTRQGLYRILRKHQMTPSGARKEAL